MGCPWIFYRARAPQERLERYATLFAFTEEKDIDIRRQADQWNASDLGIRGMLNQARNNPNLYNELCGIGFEDPDFPGWWYSPARNTNAAPPMTDAAPPMTDGAPPSETDVGAGNGELRAPDPTVDPPIVRGSQRPPLPIGSVPIGSVPIGSVPIGSVPPSSAQRARAWVNFGFVEVVPSPRTWESLHTILYDAGESFAEKSFPNIFTSDDPSLKRFFEEEILHDECLSMFSSLYISGMLNDCLPLMDSPIMNKLLGQYMLEYDGYVPTQALIHLNMKDLAYLTNMTPKRIFQIRNDASTSFENFREVWVELTRSMTKKPWEEDFEEEVNNLWEEKMVPEIDSVKKDIRNLRLKLALKALAPICARAGAHSV